MTQKHYIPIIDYLKAFAIVLVTTTHFFYIRRERFSAVYLRHPDGDAAFHVHLQL